MTAGEDVLLSSEGGDGSARRPALTRAQVLVLVGVLAVAFNLRSGLTVVGPLVPTIREATGQDNTALGLVGALPVLAFGLCSPFAPVLGRRFGLGRTLVGAMVALTAALLIRSAGGFGALLVGTVLMGAAITVGNVLLPALVKRVFPERAGMVTSLYGGVLVAGAAVAAAVAVPLARATSWQGSLALWAAPAGLAAGAVLWSILADGRPTAGGAGSGGATERVVGEPPGRDLEPRPMPSARAGRRLARDAVAWQVTAFMGLQSALFYVVFNWWTDIVLVKGITEAQAGVQLTVMSLTGLAGIVVFPALTDRSSDQRWLGVLTGVLIGGAIALLLLPSPALTMIAAVVFGFGSGGSLGLALAFIGLRTVDEQDASALSGMAQTWGYLISAGGPVAIGAINEVTGSWTVPVLLVLATSAVTAIAGWLAGRDVQVAT